MLFSSKVIVRVRFSVWLVSGYAHVLVLRSVVIAPYPYSVSRRGKPHIKGPFNNKWEWVGRSVTPCDRGGQEVVQCVCHAYFFY